MERTNPSKELKGRVFQKEGTACAKRSYKTGDRLSQVIQGPVAMVRILNLIPQKESC